MYLGSTRNYAGESYECQKCNTTYNKVAVKSNWACPVCGGEILIRAPDGNGGEVFFVRVMPINLKNGDYIHHNGGCYEVVSVSVTTTNFKKGMITVYLKGFGGQLINDKLYVNRAV